MLIPLSDLYVEVCKAAIKENISVRAWCVQNNIGERAFRTLVHQMPHKQGKLMTYLKVCKALKGGVIDE